MKANTNFEEWPLPAGRGKSIRIQALKSGVILQLIKPLHNGEHQIYLAAYKAGKWELRDRATGEQTPEAMVRESRLSRFAWQVLKSYSESINNFINKNHKHE